MKVKEKRTEIAGEESTSGYPSEGRAKESSLQPGICSRGTEEKAASEEEPESSLHGLRAQLVSAALSGSLRGSRDW